MIQANIVKLSDLIDPELYRRTAPPTRTLDKVMEAYLRKITQCLGKAVTELEQVSISEKTANEVDAEWITRFHAGIAIPPPLDTATLPATLDVGGHAEGGQGETNLRWTVLESTWLPLLHYLQYTVRLLDREEDALQAQEQRQAEEAAAAAEKSQDGAPSPAARKPSQAPPRPPKGLLSLRDYAVIHTALEIVVHWGLVPVLEPGVGVFEADKRPRSRAVRVSRRVLHYFDAGQDPHPSNVGRVSSSDPDLKPCGPSTPCVRGDTSSVPGVGNEYSKHAQLALCTSVIQGVVTTEQFMPMLMPLYLPDLLASRLQLVYGRTAAAAAAAAASTAAAETAPSTITGSRASLQQSTPSGVWCSAKASSEGSHLTSPKSTRETGVPDPGLLNSPLMLSSLRAMLTDMGPREVMGALRHLLSQGKRAPLWLRQRAGRILSEIVLRPGGVQATLEVYLAGAAAGGGEGGGREEADRMKVCLRVAKLLATPPKHVGSGHYVSRVAPQLAEMLHFDGQQRAIVTRVVVMIIGRLCESMPADTRRLILYPLLRPLLLFWGPKGRQSSSSGSRPLSSLSVKNGPVSNSRKISPSPSQRPSSHPLAAKDVAPSVGESSLGTSRRAAATGKVDQALGGGGDISGDHTIVSSEVALDRCLEDLEKLLTAAPAHAALLGLLSRMGVTAPLFRLHCFCANAKSRHLQGTKACLSSFLSLSTTAAPDLVTGLLPVSKTGWGAETEPRFSPGPTGGVILRAVPSTYGRRGRRDPSSEGMREGALGNIPAKGDGVGRGSKGARPTNPQTDDSLMGIESALEGLGLDPETLRLFGSAAAAAAAGGGEGDMEFGGEGGSRAGLVDAFLGLKEAEKRAQAAADVLEELGEGSPIAGKVFDMLLRRYLSLRDCRGTPVAAAAAKGVGFAKVDTPEASTSAAAEEHAVMASIVVLAERLGTRVFGTGMQMLSCIRLVLEHEQPPGQSPGRKTDGADNGGGDGFGQGSTDGFVDAAARLSRIESTDQDPNATAAAAAAGIGGRMRDKTMDKRFNLEQEKSGGEGGDGDTLCSVVLALLTTVLELGEEERTEEEEAELRAMMGPLKGLAAGHHNAEVAEMSALLCASILTRSLTPEQRREERERIKRNGGGGNGGGSAEGREARTARMLSALDAAEEDLKNEAVPIRARGVVTLTRLMRASLDSRIGGESAGGSSGRVNMDTVVAQRLMDTYARMTGDGDSYVYLAAVQGLAALADALPGWCIPRLVGIFTAASGSSSGFGPDTARGAAAELPLSQRLKIGEAVLLSARRCGEAMPKYAHYYVNAFVVAARERSLSSGCGGGSEECPPPSSSLSPSPSPSPSSLLSSSSSSTTTLETKERYYFRASCLSNLAEVCQLLRWSLGRFSQDIVDLGVGVLSMETGPSEEATLARRGASFLLGRLLRGAGEDVLQVVPAAELRAAFRALKRAAEGDRDEVTRSHARSGLGCLDVAIRGQLFPAADSAGGGGGEGAGGDSMSCPTHHPGITVLE